jgi:hypothetical protein
MKKLACILPSPPAGWTPMHMLRTRRLVLSRSPRQVTGRPSRCRNGLNFDCPRRGSGPARGVITVGSLDKLRDDPPDRGA